MHFADVQISHQFRTVLMCGPHIYSMLIYTFIYATCRMRACCPARLLKPRLAPRKNLFTAVHGSVFQVHCSQPSASVLHIAAVVHVMGDETELRCGVQGQNQSQPMRQYSSNANLAPGLSEPAGDIANGNIAHASNAGSAISSPRFGAAGRNVRPRMDQWAGAGTFPPPFPPALASSLAKTLSNYNSFRLAD